MKRADDMTYEAGFIRNRRGHALFYAEHAPANASPSIPRCLICAPLLEEHNAARGVLVNLARALAASGVRVMRFDYTGHGDSEGHTSTIGLGEWCDDVEDVAWWWQSRTRKLAAASPMRVIGCRAGALLAAMAARTVGADRLTAWCPVIDGRTYLRDLLRLTLLVAPPAAKAERTTRDALEGRLARGESVNVFGWEIGPSFYRSVVTASFARLVEQAPCPVEIFDTGAAGKLPPELTALERHAGVTVHSVAGSTFWIEGARTDLQQEALVGATVEAVAADAA
jgi:alpha/beta superfamily hydrolase